MVTGIMNFTSINAITANFTTGVIREELTVTGDADVKGTFIAEGSGFFSSGVHITGKVSGVTFTGTAAGFTTVTGTTVTGTTVNAVTGAYTTCFLARLSPATPCKPPPSPGALLESPLLLVQPLQVLTQTLLQVPSETFSSMFIQLLATLPFPVI